jgi:hypothetical protein
MYCRPHDGIEGIADRMNSCPHALGMPAAKSGDCPPHRTFEILVAEKPMGNYDGEGFVIGLRS